jgi:hypothetical protein
VSKRALRVDKFIGLRADAGCGRFREIIRPAYKLKLLLATPILQQTIDGALQKLFYPV